MLSRALRPYLLGNIIMLTATAQAVAGNAEVSTPESEANQMYWVEQVVEGLNFPSSMAWLPNGDMLITERMGGLRRVRDGKLDRQPVGGMPASYQDLFDGIKDIALDPEYRVNKTIFIYMAEGNFDQRHATVFRARYEGDRLEDVVRIFRSKDEMGGYGMIASRMTLLADSTLIIGVPEDHHYGRSQQLTSHLGKILRINRDGSIPMDNPFLNASGAHPEIWTYGHRTPLALYQDKETGVVWELEAGEVGGDELNLLKAGQNYGWPEASWSFAYGSRALAAAPQHTHSGMRDAVHLWMPSATPSGMTRYRGHLYPLWDGDYFLGHLTDRVLERFRIAGERVVLQEKMLLDIEERIRDVKVGPDNHIYVLTDHQNGRVLRLRPGQPRATELSHVAHKLAAVKVSSDFPVGGEEEVTNMSSTDLAKGRQAFQERCVACHRIAGTVPGGEVGPDLSGVYGTRMGYKAGFEYSQNMLGGVLSWNFATLNRFLENPAGLVPGTKMSSAPVMDPDMRRYIIGFLKQETSQ